jgi:hypothetical protein
MTTENTAKAITDVATATAAITTLVWLQNVEILLQIITLLGGLVLLSARIWLSIHDILSRKK